MVFMISKNRFFTKYIYKVTLLESENEAKRKEEMIKFFGKCGTYFR